MFQYHEFPDLGIPGIYDMTEHLPRYHFPDLRGSRVLDAGCASGYFSRHFVEAGATVVSCDINTESIRQLHLPVHVLEQDVHDLAFRDEFDLVFCGSLMMHCLCPMQLLGVLRKTLKPGGLLVLSTAGIESQEPVIRCDRHSGRGAAIFEHEVRSFNETLWWCSVPALHCMLQNAGFQQTTHVDSFVLTSTEYGVSIGHNFSTLHHVMHGVK